MQIEATVSLQTLPSIQALRLPSEADAFCFRRTAGLVLGSGPPQTF